MRYQLILQFRGDAIEDYDAMVTLEEELIRDLGASARVDGHDMGSGEANIFIFSSDPVQTFRQAMPALSRSGRLQEAKAAFREVGSDSFTLIWPDGSNAEFAIA
jgi:hypothetical protein